MFAYVKATIASLDDLKINKIPGTHESTLDESLTTRNGKLFLKEIELSSDMESASRRQNRFQIENHRENICDYLTLFLKNPSNTFHRNSMEFPQNSWKFHGISVDFCGMCY
jgi:hypothetical protein